VEEPVKRPRDSAAVKAWPDALYQVTLHPTEENLDRLCNLLDAIDAWVVRAHGKPYYAERRRFLTECRKESWEANRRVSEASRERQAAAGRERMERRRNRAAVGSAGLEGVGA
jgi:hypothetical protein